MNSHLVNGDSFLLVETLPTDSVDFIFTDPPYNIGAYSKGNIKFKTRKDMNTTIADWDQNVCDPLNMANDFVRILKPTGNLFIFTGTNDFGRWHSKLDPIFDTFQFFCWHKTNPGPSVRKSSFLKSVELVVCCWNKGHTWNFGKQNDMHNFFESGICQGNERLDHPTQKPLGIIEHLMRIASNPGDVVLDPFMGTGTIPYVAASMGRRYIGYEKEEKYFEMAQKRIGNNLYD